MHQQGAQNSHGSSHGRQLPSSSQPIPSRPGPPSQQPQQHQSHLHHPRLVPVETYSYNTATHSQLPMHPYNHPHRLPPPQILDRRPSTLPAPRFELAPSASNSPYPNESLPHIQTTSRPSDSHQTSHTQQINQQQPPPLVTHPATAASQPLPPPIEAPSVRLMQQQQSLTRIHATSQNPPKLESLSTQPGRNNVHKKKVIMSSPAGEHHNSAIHNSQHGSNMISQSTQSTQQQPSIIRRQQDQLQPQHSQQKSQPTQQHLASPSQQSLQRQIRSQHEPDHMEHQQSSDLPPRPLMLASPNPTGMMGPLPSMQRTQLPPPHANQSSHIQGISSIERRTVGATQVGSSPQQMGVTMDQSQSVYRNQTTAGSGINPQHRGPHSTSSVVSSLAHDAPVGQTVMSQPSLRPLPSDNFGKPISRVEMDTRNSRYPMKSGPEAHRLRVVIGPNQTAEESTSEVPDAYDASGRTNQAPYHSIEGHQQVQTRGSSQHLGERKQVPYEGGNNAGAASHDGKLRSFHQTVDNRIHPHPSGSVMQPTVVDNRRPRIDQPRDNVEAHVSHAQPPQQQQSRVNNQYFVDKGSHVHRPDESRSVRSGQQTQYAPDGQDQNRVDRRMEIPSQQDHHIVHTNIRMTEMHGSSNKHTGNTGTSMRGGSREIPAGKTDPAATGWKNPEQQRHIMNESIDDSEVQPQSEWKMEVNPRVKTNVQLENQNPTGRGETQNHGQDISTKSREANSPMISSKPHYSLKVSQSVQKSTEVQDMDSVHANSHNSNHDNRVTQNQLVATSIPQREASTQNQVSEAEANRVATSMTQSKSAVQQDKAHSTLSNHQPPMSNPSQAQNSVQGDKNGQGSSSRDPHDNMGQNINNPRKELKVEDALAYLEQVKTQFSDQLQVYNQFLDIMKDFKAQTIDTAAVIKRVSDLFVGHKDLILGFNTFLPVGYEISVTENKVTGALNTGFVSPQGFNELLPSFRKVSSKTNGTRVLGKKKTSVSSPKKKEVKKPMSANTGASIPPSMVGPSVRVDDNNMAPQGQIDINGEKFPTSDTRGSNAGLNDKTQHGIEEFRNIPGDGLQTGNSDMKPVESSSEQTEHFEQAIGFVTSLKERFSDTPDNYEKFLTALRMFRDEHKPIREFFEAVAELLGPHKDLLARLKDIIPTMACGAIQDTRPLKRTATQVTQRRTSGVKSNSNFTPAKKTNNTNGVVKGRGRSREMQFFENLKSRLGTSRPTLFNDFIKCLHLFVAEIVSREELLVLTSGIFQELPDAQSSFIKYLDSISGEHDLHTSEENQDTFSSSAEGVATAVDTAQNSKYKSRPMSEIASEQRDSVHSYRRMPLDFPQLKYSGRSTHERRTLNDTWVNVTTGSEDYAFHFMRKNQSEENLFRCEDDRYELDLVIETNASTIMKLETILATISKLPLAEKKRHALAPGVLSPIHLSTIQRIYGEDGREVLSHIKMSPSISVPIVLSRLKHKDIAWRKARMDMNRVWREIGERNFHRSLDHRSGHFKQVDKKDMSTKSLLCDILDPAGSVTARDAEMTRARSYAIPTGAGGPNDRSQANQAVYVSSKLAADMVPRSLELEFIDKKIHKVVYSLLKSCFTHENGQEHQNKRIFSKFRKLVKTFFEVSLDETDETKDDTKTRYTSNHKNIESDNNGITSEKTHTPFCADGNVVLFADDNIYILWRLYHIFFERVTTAFQLAREQVADRDRREYLNRTGRKDNPTKHGLPDLYTKPQYLTRQPNGLEMDNSFSVGPTTGTVDQIFEQYIATLHLFVRGKLDCTRYEDKCRVLLGTHCYSLFTMDKAYAKLCKQILSTFSNDTESKQMVSMFERGRQLIQHAKRSPHGITERGVERLLAASAAKHLREARGAGAYLFRIQRIDHNDIKCTCLIEVIGQTCGEDLLQARGEEWKAMTELMRCELRPQIEEQNTSYGRHVEKRSRVEDIPSESRKRRKKGQFLMKRMLKCCTERKEMLTKKKYKVVMRNCVQWNTNSQGRMSFSADEVDIWIVLNRRRKWGIELMEEERKEINERHPWTERMRKWVEEKRKKKDEMDLQEESKDVEMKESESDKADEEKKID